MRRSAYVFLIILACCLLMGVKGHAEEAQSDLLALVQKAPANNLARAARLVELLQLAGCAEKNVLRQSIDSSERGTNIYAMIKGRLEPSEVVIVGAHTDTQPGSAGIVDNWSSCVMLSALYRELSGRGTDKTFILVGFGGEEDGQNGSREFALRSTARGNPDRIVAYVNLECLGVGALRTWANQSADDLEMIFQASSEALSLSAETQILFGFKSDALSFIAAGVPTVTIHSLSGPQLAYINSRADDGATLNMENYRSSFRQIAEFLLRIDSYKGTITLADRDAELRPARSQLVAEDKRKSSGGEVVLREVPEESMEYLTGLRTGDILTAIGGEKLAAPEELRPTLLTFHKGKKVDVSVLRRSVGTGLEEKIFSLAY